VVELRFENRRFIPQTITVPANQPFKIKITNSSKEAIEFESFKLNREKVVGPGESVIVLVRGFAARQFMTFTMISTRMFPKERSTPNK